MTDLTQNGVPFAIADSGFRSRLASSLEALAVAHIDSLNASYTSGAPPQDSRAAADRASLDDEFGAWGSGIADGAVQRMLIAAIAGLDHVQTFSDTIPHQHAGMALGSIVRGAVEAFARLWWFLDATDARDLAHRSLSSFAKEFVYMDASQVLHSANRATTASAESLQGEVLDEIERLTGRRTPLGVSYTRQSSALLDRAANNDGRGRYSGLSSVAHAGDIGLGQFAAFSEGRIHFALSERTATEFAYGLYNVMTFSLRRFYDYMSYPREPGSALGLVDRATLDVLDAEYFRVIGAYPIGHPLAKP